jgi:hypothetical protein
MRTFLPSSIRIPAGKKIPQFLELALGFYQSIGESENQTDMPQYRAPLFSHALDLAKPFNPVPPDVSDTLAIRFRSYDTGAQKDFDHFGVHAAEPGRLFKFCQVRVPSGANQLIACFHCRVFSGG